MLPDDEVEALKKRGLKDANEWFTSYATEEDRLSALSNELDGVGEGRPFYNWMMTNYPDFFSETTDETYGDMSDEELEVWSKAFFNSASEVS